MEILVTQLFNGLSGGSVLLLAALGLALTFGQMGVINMAHGEFIMAGAYTTYVLQQSISAAGLSLLVALPLAFLVAGTLGALVQDAGGGQYILSNNHVLAKENGNLDYNVPSPAANDTIIQPGLLDPTCTLNSAAGKNAVADLSDFVEILFGRGKNKPLNRVDAAIAAVDHTGRIRPARSWVSAVSAAP